VGGARRRRRCHRRSAGGTEARRLPNDGEVRRHRHPVPFGLETQCAISKKFRLTCTTTASGTKLFHDDGHGNKLEVMKISLQDNRAWLKTQISRQCFNQSTKVTIYNETRMDITGMPYVLSHQDNTVIVLGCPSFAYMAGLTVSNLNIPRHSNHILLCYC
jgi:hypothetical protein